MAWEVEVTDQFADWYRSLEVADQEAVDLAVGALEQDGPILGRPRVDTVNGSRYANMKELRAQSQGDPIRVFFAFDPRRVAILLIGGDKTGDKQFYERMIPYADSLYEAHLAEIAKEQEQNG